MTAKEIAALVRATNVLDESAMDAAANAIQDRSEAREAIGESAAMEDALLDALAALREMARRLTEAMEHEAAERTAVASLLRTPGQIVRLSMGTRLTYQSNHAAPTIVARYEELAARLVGTVDLYAAVADLVRSTPEERAAVLAERERAAAESAERARGAAERAQRKGRKR